MSDRCPQDGGFIGECGCTHPNHEHSELVKGLLSAQEPDFIAEADAEAALVEGFYVTGPNGRVGFGKRILDHWSDTRPGHQHSAKDVAARKQRLAFAVATVRAPDTMNDKVAGHPGRISYTKAFKDFGIIVLSDPTQSEKAVTFTYVPKSALKRKAERLATWPAVAPNPWDASAPSRSPDGPSIPPFPKCAAGVALTGNGRTAARFAGNKSTTTHF